MKKIRLILIFSLIIPCSVFATGWQEISPQRVYSLLKEGSGLWLIDVRNEMAFATVHIEGAINIPSIKLTQMRFPKGRMLILTDASLGDLQAREAANKLVARQNDKVFVLKGGLTAWQRAALPISGDIRSWEVVRILPVELTSALAAKTRLRILDLRNADERKLSPLKEAEIADGKNLAERLKSLQALRKEYAQPNLAGKLKDHPPVVIVLPTGAAAGDLYQQQLWAWPGDIRVLEGGYLSRTDQRQIQTISNVEGCPTCPGGIREGK